MIDLTKIPFKQSPNFSHNGKNAMTHVILHAMVGTFEGSKAWFSNPKAMVSAHYLVSQKGEVLQMVHDTQVAWHCYGMNTKSIGIELEDHGLCMKGEWVTPALWEKAIDLVAALAQAHHIPVLNILPHSEPFIQKLGGAGFAHHDPGPHFDLLKFRADVATKLKGQAK